MRKTTSQRYELDNSEIESAIQYWLECQFKASFGDNVPSIKFTGDGGNLVCSVTGQDTETLPF